ncbi:hypothetical protein BD626DRAFT_53655 [Schizophyllum amplum]|uniref:Uncharacterized protein n=1 Tax=Schizophyllum amplum TaxID=97359 RepID=A0A550CD60_9AGAR|nr:hypothetical protein BD626DRAFT_53655 [Auriculariopsis ampla]
MDLGDMISVNSFVFCKHGHEFCNHCQCDFRTTNDYSGASPEDALAALNAEMKRLQTGQESPGRKPLSIAGRFVATNAKDEAGGTVYACKEHNAKDCSRCFNWPQLIREEKIKKDKGKVEDREQIIGLLQSMGVEFPPGNKLADDALERRLTSALNFAQDLPSFSRILPFKPSEHPSWKEKHSKPVFEATRRGNLTEAFQNALSVREGRGRMSLSLYENAFIDARQTVMHLAKNYDNGHKVCVLQDKEQQEAICIRILDVHALDDKTPCYASSTPPAAPKRPCKIRSTSFKRK